MAEQMALVTQDDDGRTYVTRLSEEGLASGETYPEGWEEWMEFVDMEDALSEVQHILGV